jgi:hypothetical protein
MPLHLILIMTAAISFMLWLAFQDGGEAELCEFDVETDADPRADPVCANDEVEVRRLAA